MNLRSSNFVFAHAIGITLALISVWTTQNLTLLKAGETRSVSPCQQQQDKPESNPKQDAPKQDAPKSDPSRSDTSKADPASSEKPQQGSDSLTKPVETEPQETSAKDGSAQKSKGDKDSGDQETKPRKMTLGEERIAALKKQFESEKVERPDTPKIDRIRQFKPGQPISLTFDDIKFDMKIGEKFQRKMVTSDIRELHGKTIQLKGYIKPGAKERGLKKFIFVRDDKECCFGPGAALYDCVIVTMAKDKPTNFSVLPVTIEGKFYLKEYLGNDGKVWAIYRMKNGRRK